MQIYDELKEQVSIYDLFEIADPPTTFLTRVKPCQISCPFHGQDTHPSARVYPDTNSFRCFTCSKSWNAVTFWAEANDWFTGTGTLDIGRAIQDLCLRFNISDHTFDWERKFHALKVELTNSEKEVSLEERYKLSSYYSWNVSKLIHNIEDEDRKALYPSVLALWDDFVSIDLSTSTWQEDLTSWYQSAKVIVDAEKL